MEKKIDQSLEGIVPGKIVKLRCGVVFLVAAGTKKYFWAQHRHGKNILE